MVLLDVLDERWVIKLCGVIAVGRQIAVRPNKGIQDIFFLLEKLNSIAG